MRPVLLSCKPEHPTREVSQALHLLHNTSTITTVPQTDRRQPDCTDCTVLIKIFASLGLPAPQTRPAWGIKLKLKQAAVLARFLRTRTRVLYRTYLVRTAPAHPPHRRQRSPKAGLLASREVDHDGREGASSWLQEHEKGRTRGVLQYTSRYAHYGHSIVGASQRKWVEFEPFESRQGPQGHGSMGPACARVRRSDDSERECGPTLHLVGPCDLTSPGPQITTVNHDH